MMLSIVDALIDRAFLIFGPLKSLIVDEDRAFSLKVMHCFRCIENRCEMYFTL